MTTHLKTKLILLMCIVGLQTSIMYTSSLKSESILLDKAILKSFWEEHLPIIQGLIDSGRSIITIDDATMIDQALTLGETNPSVLDFQIQYIILNLALVDITTIMDSSIDLLESLKNRSKMLIERLSIKQPETTKKSSSHDISHTRQAMLLSFWNENLPIINNIVKFNATKISNETAQIVEQAIQLGEDNIAISIDFKDNYDLLSFALSGTQSIDTQPLNYLSQLQNQLSHLIKLLEIEKQTNKSDNQPSGSGSAVAFSQYEVHKKASADDSSTMRALIEYAENQFYNPEIPREVQIPFREIETSQVYLDKTCKNFPQDRIKILHDNLAPTEYIIDARGDGNCGYRAFLGSLFFNAFLSKNNNIYPHIIRLLQEKFAILFDTYNPSLHRLTPAIIAYLIQTIKNLQKSKSIEEIRILLNNEIAFDSYMIMFFRYLIVDHINNFDTKLINEMIRDDNYPDPATDPNEYMIVSAILADKFDRSPAATQQLIHQYKTNNLFEIYKQKILSWGDLLTADQTIILARVTNITIERIIEHFKSDQPYALTYPLGQLIGTADILFVGGHYRIFIPKSYEPDYLEKFFNQKIAGAQKASGQHQLPSAAPASQPAINDTAAKNNEKKSVIQPLPRDKFAFMNLPEFQQLKDKLQEKNTK